MSIVEQRPVFVKSVTLRNVATNGDGDDSGSISTLVVKSGGTYSSCKTQLKKLVVYFEVNKDGEWEKESKVISMNDVMGAALKIPDRFEEPLEFRKATKKSNSGGLYSCTWTVAKDMTFPLAAELQVTVPNKKNKPVTTEFFHVMLTDPIKADGCCVIA